jgi:GNAT superfamily N-acetyltransferase
MSYEFLREVPSVEDYLRLRREAGLGGKSADAAAKGLPNSLFAVTVFHEGAAVGMGRVIGDGGCFFEVVDIAVAPEHRGKGLGQRIMQEIMNFIERNALPGAYVSLITNRPAFYERFGFKPTSPPDDGMFIWFPLRGEG